MSPAVAGFLDEIELGAPTTWERLTLWPLLPKAARRATQLAFTLLGEALERGDVVVEEVSAGGAVPNVRVRSLVDEAVLVLFGEELRGAKQNRIANASFLIPPRGEVVIDVSCVEAGRWHASASGGPAARFERTGPVVSNTIRRRMHQSVSEARSHGLAFRADQGAVWDEVDARLRASGTASRSRAWSDFLGARQEQLESARSSFAPRGVGFVAALDGEIVGLEAVNDPQVYARCFARLVDSYLIDALDDTAASEPKVAPGASASAPADFVAAVRAAPETSGATLGLGEDVRLNSDAVEGAALVAGEVVHLRAAPRLEASDRPSRGRSLRDRLERDIAPFEESLPPRRRSGAA